MSGDFERRLLEDGDDLERSLLASAKSDAPSPNARRRTLVALGLGSSLVTATTATAASTAGLGIVKWIGLAVLGSALVAGGVHQAAAPSEPPARPPPAAKIQKALVSKVVGATSQQAAAAAPAPEREPAALAAEPEPAEPAPAEPAPKKVAVAPKEARATQSAPSLADEVAALDRAREALAGGDAAEAIQALEQHDAKFGKKGGLLGPEAMVLRIEALAAKGDRAGAAALANEFLARHPDSPHASRVRSILAAQTAQ